MPDDWDRYIKEYPRGRFVEEAMRKKTDAVRRIEEENTLKLARSNDTFDSWKNYADKYPSGNAVADAKKRMEQLTWLTFADLKAVPAGSFLMGNLKGDGDEKPTHRVEVDTFRIGRTEVTNAQYLKFLEETKRAKPADPDFAKMGGYDRPILHGLCTFGFAGRAVLGAWCGNDPARMKAFEVRFSGVVFPGETITTDMWQIAPGKIVLTAKTERGEAVLSSAAAEVMS